MLYEGLTYVRYCRSRGFLLICCCCLLRRSGSGAVFGVCAVFGWSILVRIPVVDGA